MIGGKKIFTNTVLLIICSLINLGVSLITTALIARTLGPELYGKYTFGLTYILLFSVLANFGIEALFVREASRDKENITNLIMDIFHLKCVLALLTVAIIIFSANLLNYPDSTVDVIVILSIGLFFQIMSSSLMSVYQSLEKIEVLVCFSILFRILTAVFITISIFLGIGLMGIVSAFTFGNILVFLIGYIVFYRDFGILHFKFNLYHWGVLIARGFPFFASALLTMVYGKINILMLSKMQGELQIGFYMAAVVLVEALYFIPEAVNTSIFPAFSRIYGFSIAALEKIYIKLMKYLILITVAVCGGCLLIGDKILLLIYGDAFLESVPILNALIFFWALMFFSNMMSNLLFSINRERDQVKIMVLGCVTNIVLNILLIREYGLIGSAYALVITQGLVVILLAGLLWKNNLRYIPDWRILRLLLVLIVMVVTVRALDDFNVVIGIIGGAISYVCFLFVFRIFDAEDIIYIKSLIKIKSAANAQ